jgi:hypothetical protein
MQSKVSKRPRSLEQEAAKGCDGDHCYCASCRRFPLMRRLHAERHRRRRYDRPAESWINADASSLSIALSSDRMK